MSDLISRQAAINAVTESGDYFDMIERLNELPSAEPEIIRCKDCKWLGEIGCAINIADDSDRPKETDFCSYAERRTDAADKC